MSIFYLAISFYCFNLTQNYTLFIIGIIAPIFLLMNTLILDKFSALVRWCNDQNKKNFPSYIRKKKLLRFFLTFEDINFLSIIFLFFYKNDIVVTEIIFSIICLSIFLSSIINLIMHSFYAYRYLSFSKK